jgi:hypothetical protein
MAEKYSKKTWNTQVKVPQSTIDTIKKMGMTTALSIAGSSKKAEAGGYVSADDQTFREGVRRMYGDTRYQNAIYKAKASPGPIQNNPTLGSLASKNWL